DGDTSLGVVDAAPFELDVAVSSADSGAHAYSALATDTAGQTAQSEEVMLSINIVGGEVMFYRDNLFPGSTGIGGPGLAIASTGTGRVLVNGYVAGTATGRVQAFNDDLSSLWTDNGAGLTRARAADVDGQVLVSTWLDGSWTYDLRALDSSAVVDSLTLGVPAGDITVQLVGSRGTTGGDGLVLTTLPNTLASYSTTFAGPAWTVELADDAVITDLDPFGDGATLITFNTEGQCAPGAQTCLRRVEPNGDIAWTAGLGSGVVATVRSSGAVAAVATRSSDGVSYTELASNGSNAGPELVLDERNDYPGVPDVAADGAGGIVLVGTLGPVGDETAVATRFDANGELTWQQAAIATGPDSMGLGVSVYEDAAFVCGIENLETAGLSTNGDVFAAKLRL
ncbi:MAG: hypothetical protein NXI35_37520, partial [bacterium]|nr:hypothetical protein [bacterium]